MTIDLTNYDFEANEWRINNDFNELVVKEYFDTLQYFTWKNIASFKGCGVWLKDGTDIACKVVAEDELGNCSVLTESNTCRQYLRDEIL